MKRMIVCFVILMVICACAAAGAEVSFTPFPEEDTVYLFRRALQGEIPPAPQVTAEKNSVMISGLAPWGIPEEYMQTTYQEDQAWGMVEAGAAPEGTLGFKGKPDEFSLSVPADEPFAEMTLSLREKREYKGQYTVTIKITDRNGDSLTYRTEDGSYMIEYGAMTAYYDPDGMLTECRYSKKTENSDTFYRYEKDLRTDMPVYRLTSASYEDRKVTETWEPDMPEKDRKKLKHLTPDNPPFRIIGQEEADRIVAERTDAGLAWLAIPTEEAVCRVAKYPPIPAYDCVTGGGTATLTLSGLADWLVPEEDMRAWTMNPADGTWTPSEELLQDKAVFIIPWDESSGERETYFWSPTKNVDPEWNVCFNFDTGNFSNGRSPWSIEVTTRDGQTNYFFHESYGSDSLELSFYCSFGDKLLSLGYEPDGYLSSYVVTDETHSYGYHYSGISDGMILYMITIYGPEGEIMTDYGRDANDYWYQVDPSGKKIPCDRPAEADACPPMPLR